MSDEPEVDTSANPDPEDDQPDTSENDKKGGSEGRDARKINRKRRESANDEEVRLRTELAELQSRRERDQSLFRN